MQNTILNSVPSYELHDTTHAMISNRLSKVRYQYVNLGNLTYVGCGAWLSS